MFLRFAREGEAIVDKVTGSDEICCGVTDEYATKAAFDGTIQNSASCCYENDGYSKKIDQKGNYIASLEIASHPCCVKLRSYMNYYVYGRSTKHKKKFRNMICERMDSMC